MSQKFEKRLSNMLDQHKPLEREHQNYSDDVMCMYVCGYYCIYRPHGRPDLIPTE